MEDVQVVAMLVRRCIAGDAAAWEEIVQTYNRRIYNLCYRFAGSACRDTTAPRSKVLSTNTVASPDAIET